MHVPVCPPFREMNTQLMSELIIINCLSRGWNEGRYMLPPPDRPMGSHFTVVEAAPPVWAHAGTTSSAIATDATTCLPILMRCSS